MMACIGGKLWIKELVKDRMTIEVELYLAVRVISSPNMLL